MSDKFVTVYWAEDEVEAELMLAMFNENDIPCRKMRESLGTTIGLSVGILGQIAIAVPEDRVPEAEALIISMDDEDNEFDEEDEVE